jgi:two-component system, cell cycle response regulator CpdR
MGVSHPGFGPSRAGGIANMETLPPRVLLVDDEKYVRESLYTLLEREGYEVLASSNGPDALNIFRLSVRPIELLVTDYNMPEMSGLELARECSRLSGDLKVLYVSGSRPDEELRTDLQAAQRGFLAKPFRGGDLLRKARELLLARTADQLSLSSWNSMRSPARSSIDGNDPRRGEVDQADLIERRARLRFPFKQRVRFKTPGQGDPVAGIGWVVNMSSGGLLVACQEEVGWGTQLELSIDWPTRLDGRVPLQLIATGKVIRCETFTFAVGLERYHFRIARRTDLLTEESYGASGQHRRASA